MRRGARCAAALAIAVALLAQPGLARAVPAAVASWQVQGALRVRSVWLRLPAGSTEGERLQVLVALHGMGGRGEVFARDLVQEADRNGWVLVAPTIEYGDWRDPNVVAREDPALIEWLVGYLDDLPSRTGLALRQRVFLLGHSRGAQLAQRFALFHPERTRAVASISAGTYTLPMGRTAQGGFIPFPFGIGDLPSYLGRPLNQTDLRAVQFWVAVGADDNNASDLPRQWDPYLGTTRVQRARAFQSLLRQAGERSALAIYGGVRHSMTPAMRRDATAFFRALFLAGDGAAPLRTPSGTRPVPY